MRRKGSLGPRPEAKPYVVLDGGPGAPTGFGFRVGSTMTTYVGQKRGPTGTPIRFTLGNVSDMGLDEAGDACREHLALLKETERTPSTSSASSCWSRWRGNRKRSSGI